MRRGTPLVVEHLEGILRAAISRFPELVTEFACGKAKSIGPIYHSTETTLQTPRLTLMER